MSEGMCLTRSGLCPCPLCRAAVESAAIRSRCDGSTASPAPYPPRVPEWAPYRTPDERDDYQEEKIMKPLRNSTKATLTGLTLPPLAILTGLAYDHTRDGSGLRSGIVYGAMSLAFLIVMRSWAWAEQP